MAHLVGGVGGQDGEDVEEEVAIGTKGIGWRVFPGLEPTTIQQMVSL